MKKEMEVKSHVLEMLKEMLMGNDGGKFKPKMVSMEIVIPKKGSDKEGLDEVLEDAARAHPVHEEPDGDEYCEGGMAKKYSKGGAVEGTGLDEPGGFEDMDLQHADGDNFEVEKKPKMSLKEFLKSRK
jgi:hypothetical protein